MLDRYRPGQLLVSLEHHYAGRSCYEHRLQQGGQVLELLMAEVVRLVARLLRLLYAQVSEDRGQEVEQGMRRLGVQPYASCEKSGGYLAQEKRDVHSD